MTKVTMYTTGTCVYCHAQKQFLNEHNIDFQEVRVDQDVKAAEEMVKLSGQLGVPFTAVAQDDGEVEYILGFDQHRLEHALGIA